MERKHKLEMQRKDNDLAKRVSEMKKSQDDAIAALGASH